MVVHYVKGAWTPDTLPLCGMALSPGDTKTSDLAKVACPYCLYLLGDGGKSSAIRSPYICDEHDHGTDSTAYMCKIAWLLEEIYNKLSTPQED